MCLDYLSLEERTSLRSAIQFKLDNQKLADTLFLQ